MVAGHILFALRDTDSLRAITFGWVPESWARREHPRWWADVVSARAASAHSGSNVGAGAHERVGESGDGAGEVAVGDGVDGRAADGLGGGEL